MRTSARIGIAALALSGIAAMARPAAGARCVGDCRGTGAVSVIDVVTGVNVALGRDALEVCAALDANGDGKVSVDELQQAVANALNGCGPGLSTPCGDAVCRPGEICCNPLLSLCAPPPFVCIQ
jgi:hypothetical protein